MPYPRNKAVKPLVLLIVLILLTALVAQCVLSMSSKSATYDEVAHLFAGYIYVTRGTYVVNPEHPPLIKILAGLPMLLMNLDDPQSDGQKDIDLDELLDAKTKKQRRLWITRQWSVGSDFLFIRNDCDTILFWSRLPMVLLSVLLALLVFHWASELYGQRAGLFALFLYAFSPNILAHSRLVTTDLGVTLFSVVALYQYWQYTRHGKPRQRLLCGVALGLAMLSKFSAVNIVPFLLCITLVQLWRPVREIPGADFPAPQFVDRRPWLRKCYSLSCGLLIVFSVAALLVFLFYALPSNNLIHLKAGLKAASYHRRHGHQAFLIGQYSMHGWWNYFIVAFLIKTPLAMLATLVAAVTFWRRGRMKFESNECFLVVPVVVTFLMASFLFNIQIGLRHILIVYPLLFIFVSRLVTLRPNRTWIKAVGIGCIMVWYASSSLIAYPHYIPYFNELIGGPDRGHEYLNDSNICWGQDAKGLKKYLDENDIGIIKLRLNMNKQQQLEYYDIYYDEISDFEKRNRTPGLYAVDLRALYGLSPDEPGDFAWLREEEPIERIGHSIWIFDVKE